MPVLLSLSSLPSLELHLTIVPFPLCKRVRNPTDNTKQRHQQHGVGHSRCGAIRQRCERGSRVRNAPKEAVRPVHGHGGLLRVGHGGKRAGGRVSVSVDGCVCLLNPCSFVLFVCRCSKGCSCVSRVFQFLLDLLCGCSLDVRSFQIFMT